MFCNGAEKAQAAITQHRVVPSACGARQPTLPWLVSLHYQRQALLLHVTHVVPRTSTPSVLNALVKFVVISSYLFDCDIGPPPSQPGNGGSIMAAQRGCTLCVCIAKKVAAAAACHGCTRCVLARSTGGRSSTQGGCSPAAVPAARPAAPQGQRRPAPACSEPPEFPHLSSSKDRRS